jgi:SAM-dependent methyltransferase
MYKINCRGCDGTNLKSVVSLGNSPLANNLLDSLTEEEKLYPLEMMYCSDCTNCQLSYVVPASEMFDNYLYVSSTSKSFREHFERAANAYVQMFNLNENSLVVDIGSNDGIALKPFQSHGVKVVGVEPAKNVADIANQNNVETLNEYFSTDTVETILQRYGQADVVTASNVFAHADGLEEIAHAAFKLLKSDGSFIIEVQYLLDTIKDLTFDNIYHEHVNYWSVTSLNNFFNRLGYRIYKVEHVDTHGGSIRVYVTNHTYDGILDNTVSNFLSKETAFGLREWDTYTSFAQRIEETKNNTRRNLRQLRDTGLRIVGYGSPAKATTVLNYYGITTDELDYIVEDNALKHNKIVPSVRIPIYSKEKLKEVKPDIILVMAWNFFDEIKKNNQDLIEQGIQVINIKELST